MKKLLSIILFAIVLFAAVILVTKNTIAQRALVKIIQEQTGFPTTIESVEINPFQAHLAINSLKLSNPEPYLAAEAFNVKEMRVEYDTKSLFSDNIVIHLAILDISNITVVRNAKGQLNLNTMVATIQKNRGAKAEPPSAEKPAEMQPKPTPAVVPQSEEKAPAASETQQSIEKYAQTFVIEKLTLRLGNAEYIDYSQDAENPVKRTLELNDERTYTHVTSVQDIMAQIIKEVVVKQGVHQIMDIAGDHIKELKGLNIKDEDIEKASTIINGLFNALKKK